MARFELSHSLGSFVRTFFGTNHLNDVDKNQSIKCAVFVIELKIFLFICNRGLVSYFTTAAFVWSVMRIRALARPNQPSENKIIATPVIPIDIDMI